MDADDLDPFLSQHQGNRQRCSIPIGGFVAQDFANESFAGMADQNWAAKIVVLVAIGQQLKVVLMGFPKTDPGVETDLVGFNS